MTEETRERLRTALTGVLLPVHCNGCDEWMCEPVEGEDERYMTRVLDAVQQALETNTLPVG